MAVEHFRCNLTRSQGKCFIFRFYEITGWFHVFRSSFQRFNATLSPVLSLGWQQCASVNITLDQVHFLPSSPPHRDPRGVCLSPPAAKSTLHAATAVCCPPASSSVPSPVLSSACTHHSFGWSWSCRLLRALTTATTQASRCVGVRCGKRKGKERRVILEMKTAVANFFLPQGVL